ncbi:hypothetical protein ABZZ17_24060 [Streptomyces sp. NPDC006512]|uniref:hypothetical protein n=1 Tax=Streptomyces sp. NPDC006512 TaxID=3154307 RepID=UPI0033BF725A
MTDLGEQLRKAAESHQPDRARILARVQRGTADPGLARPYRRRRTAAAPWSRVTLATMAAAGALLVAGYVTAEAVQDTVPRHDTGAAPLPADPGPGTFGQATPHPQPDRSTSGEPGHTPVPTPTPPAPTPDPDPGRTAPPATTGAPSPSLPSGGERTEDGPLWADGSVDPGSRTHWSQSNVTLKTRQPLTALTVELRVAQTGGVKSSGSWQTLPGADFTFSVHEQSGTLVYRWELKAGRTVPAGTHVFAGQYDHTTSGRNAVADRYEATAGAARSTFRVGGDFARTT